MYAGLPGSVRSQALRAYHLFRRDAPHPGLNFKKVDESNNIYDRLLGTGSKLS
jgi:hypothetical protein